VKNTARLKQLLKDKSLLVAPGAFDVLSARIIAMAGHQAVYMTGYGTSASVIGQPDVGLLTMSEMAERARNIAAAVDVPVIADGDTGFGNPLNVIRTVKAYELAGAAGIQLEDQVFPKRCGHMLGRRVIAKDEMIQKIKAAADARQDDDFVIIARTDARTTLGLEQALERGKAYAEAGADVLFIESPESIDELRQITQAFPNTPTLANMIEGGRTPFLPTQQLEALGFAIAIYPTGPLYAAAKAVNRYLEALRNTGTTIGKVPDMVPFEEFNRLIGLPQYNELEQRYAVA
jgi:carboxyvinyl-carboxyphosphonate phosphorylmutase